MKVVDNILYGLIIIYYLVCVYICFIVFGIKNIIKERKKLINNMNKRDYSHNNNNLNRRAYSHNNINILV
jgi:hypothetical protein